MDFLGNMSPGAEIAMLSLYGGKIKSRNRKWMDHIERNRAKGQKKARTTGCSSQMYTTPNFPDYMK